MKKWIIYMTMLLLVIIPLVSAAGEICEISGDNTTWRNFTDTYYGGAVYADGARVDNLNYSTTYYIRCKNTGTQYGYLTVETDEGGLDEMEIAFILGIAAVAFFFLIFAMQLQTEHFFLKLLLIFFAISTIIVIPNALLTGESGSSAISLLKITTWFFRIFIVYFSIYLFWHWIQKSEAFLGTIEKIRGKFAGR